MMDPVDTILKKYQISGPWMQLQSTGIANRIYVTKEHVIRIATDHPEAFSDARTESVAAPIAYAAGICTPRLVAFDDTQELTDRPFSIWERVHGETLGLLNIDAPSFSNVWREVGRQLYNLHNRVICCDDPDDYLDKPLREDHPEHLLKTLVDKRRISISLSKKIEILFKELQIKIVSPVKTCFLHYDLHEMNIMCTREGKLLALIDWGDAGWGDASLEFSNMPLAAIPYALEGYSVTASIDFRIKIAWDKLVQCLDKALDEPTIQVPLKEIRALAFDDKKE